MGDLLREAGGIDDGERGNLVEKGEVRNLVADRPPWGRRREVPAVGGQGRDDRVEHHLLVLEVADEPGELLAHDSVSSVSRITSICPASTWLPTSTRISRTRPLVIAGT